MANKRIKIRPKQLKKAFPSEYTKMRTEDFFNVAVAHKNILNEDEYNDLVNNPESHEYFVKRHKHCAELIPMEDD